MIIKSVKNILCLFVGCVSLATGIVGIFLPVLPTTPFLILASFCFLKSSDKLYNKLINNKYLGSYILNYTKYRALKKSTKIKAITMLWLSMIFSIYVTQNFYIAAGLVLTGAFVTVYILSLNTYKMAEENIEQ